MVFSVRFATALNLKVWDLALCSGSTVTSEVCRCTIIVSSRKMMSVANMCAVIVHQIAIELFFFNDVLVSMFIHFNCLRSCVDPITCVPEFFVHVAFSVLLSPR